MDDTQKALLLMPISEMVDKMVPVGSRVTCNPAPTDTDEDYLLLIDPPVTEMNVDGAFDRAFYVEQVLNRVCWHLRNNGWEVGGSLPTDIQCTINPADRFQSWTLDDLNLILTTSYTFYQRFLAATSVSTRLNLLDKKDRIALFQAVLYGNFEDE